MAKIYKFKNISIDEMNKYQMINLLKKAKNLIDRDLYSGMVLVLAKEDGDDTKIICQSLTGDYSTLLAGTARAQHVINEVMLS